MHTHTHARTHTHTRMHISTLDWVLTSYLLPFPILLQAPSLPTELSSVSLGMAIPVGAAAEKRGLCSQEAHGLTPYVPDHHSP